MMPAHTCNYQDCPHCGIVCVQLLFPLKVCYGIVSFLLSVWMSLNNDEMPPRGIGSFLKIEGKLLKLCVLIENRNLLCKIMLAVMVYGLYWLLQYIYSSIGKSKISTAEFKQTSLCFYFSYKKMQKA